ncbi:unnamed protein product [Rotaria magnacalcarata]|uniref:G-protein coupled receptors family 1 profile domain-containing protein n=1 Tax=Rotaria magnacalcarata TaxID=392030 RepID=A0A816AQ92_9BILA|nr:unnamed protein product [Rotaria magnacalcarata]CAF1600545.1 unnamed protein product [Rotaria magnacalcarata]CAF4426293.1 unnamed protein product [Rotaria magnacalcarata]CAF4480935.1 unnamed protein product [Rotaria magnacalcarata]
MQRYYSFACYPIIASLLSMTITLAFSLPAYHNVRRITRLQLLVIRRRLALQMTAMTLARVLVLIVCGLPFICSLLWKLNINTPEDNYLGLTIFSLISSILDSVFYANFAINFYVFLMISSRFCRQVKNIILKKCWALVKTRRHETPSYIHRNQIFFEPIQPSGSVYELT